MVGLASRNFSGAEEIRTFDKGRLELLSLGGTTVGRATFEPGWKWSECVKPIAGTDSCEVHHLGYVVSGRMHVVMDDGTEGDAGPGDLAEIAPGHDAWIVGDENCVWLDFLGAGDYAKR